MLIAWERIEGSKLEEAIGRLFAHFARRPSARSRRGTRLLCCARDRDEDRQRRAMANMSALDRCRHFGVADIRGMAYMPGPSDYKPGVPPGTLYESSDFYTNVFEELWGARIPERMDEGRKDLYRFRQQLGINFIHCYDWAAPVTQQGQKLLEHVTFLRVCAQLGMKVTIPISNYTMKLLSEGKIDEARSNVEKVIEEVYTAVPPPGRTPLSGVGMWKVFNEYELWHDRRPDHVVTVMSCIAEWEARNGIQDHNALPIMVCTSFGLHDGIEGAGYLKEVRDVLLRQTRIGRQDPSSFWSERVVFATNPQNTGPDILSYLSTRLPRYWRSKAIVAPPVMFTELGSSVEQAGSESRQAEWLTLQIAASQPGGSEGRMLGACVFLNQERPWESRSEASFGITRFGLDTSWGLPRQNYQARTTFPVWDPRGWWWQKDAVYPVEQQAPKPNYQSVAMKWRTR